MSDSAIAAIQGNVLHIPTVLGAVVITYNIPGVSQQSKFTPALIADIFLGKLTKWNDARITALNPGLGIPNMDILVVHRSDGSGTSYIFTDYLSKVSAEWQSKVGKGTSVNWPVGLGGRGNEGVAATVRQTPERDRVRRASIRAINHDARSAVLQNKSGMHQSVARIRHRALLRGDERHGAERPTSACRSRRARRPDAYPIGQHDLPAADPQDV